MSANSPLWFDYVIEPNVEYGDVPPIFRPVKHLRSTDVIPPRNRDLTSMEKNWLCREYLGQNMGLDGKRRPPQSQTYLIKEYNLYSSFFAKKLDVFENQGYTNAHARPGKIPRSDIKLVATTVAELRVANNEPSVKEVVAMLRQARILRTEVCESEHIEGLSDGEGDDGPTYDTVKRCIKKHFLLQTPNKVAHTEARVKATGCPYMSYNWYLVNYTYSAQLPATNKWNADGTTFVFCPYGDVNKCVRLSEEDEHYFLLDFEGVKTKYSGQSRRLAGAGFDFAIKIMHLCNANGDMGPMVAIVAMASMGKDEFYVEKVPLFANAAGLNQFGYLYFTETRAGNSPMWAHYLEHVLVPTIKEVGTAYGTHEQGYFFQRTPKTSFVKFSTNPSATLSFQMESRTHVLEHL